MGKIFKHLTTMCMFIAPFIVFAQDEEDPDGPPLPPASIDNYIYGLIIIAITIALFYYMKKGIQFKTSNQ
ncbi:hypothetical protein GCM10007424_16110 [Flavobacterium suaedae]|uniref:Signal peptidase n=1 Tax=Flavobacterium suaedae TaxID=1767027 RepID=A0ABQ1JSV6_9FLAO|nr:hypothetical protein [Flavobacterium suaedae]GGB76850.1 hypothetical protein GCM10007424_16110 [Flavobacterium suaedae]